ncbi:MAG: hypothetical protein D3917_15190 [Candidatus Electrothrix sp. AX5]|jgi:hypothetical protein|nr:hypothetical protein [Candidatus Electrothrix sp. AX5]
MSEKITLLFQDEERKEIFQKKFSAYPFPNVGEEIVFGNAEYKVLKKQHHFDDNFDPYGFFDGPTIIFTLSQINIMEDFPLPKSEK